MFIVVFMDMAGMTLGSLAGLFGSSVTLGTVAGGTKGTMSDSTSTRRMAL
jgi:hypothetical protein